MPHLRVLFQRLILLIALLAAGATLRADDRKPAEILPPTTVIYAEVPHPQELLTTVYDHKLVQRIQELDQVRSAMEKKEYLNFKAGVAVIESQMGMPWRKVLEQTVGGGFAFAVDAKTQGAVIVAKATNETTATKLLETLANLANLDARTKGNPEPVKTSDYRGIKVYILDKGRYFATAQWLVITNNEEFGKQIVDRIAEPAPESLAANEQFHKVYAAHEASATVWGYVNTAAIREAGVAKKVFGGQADNPLAELVLGGILSTLQHTPYATFSLEVSDRQVRLSACAPFDRTWAGETREYYFGPEGKGAAPAKLSIDGAIACASGYRDVSAMWRRAGDLLDEKHSDELTKADSSLTTLFAGKDFAEDILGEFQPDGQVIVTRQEFAADQPTPAIKLPAFGLVAQMKDQAKMQPELRRIFQSLIGFLNIVGAMDGQPQLELDMEKSDAAQFVTASYLPDAKAKDAAGLKINYNFSPSIGFAGDRFVIASTKSLAHTLATAKAADEKTSDAACVVNTDAVLHFDPLQSVLRDNRAQLIAQNMLKEGHTKQEAEKNIDLLLEFVGYLDQLKVSLDTTPTELHILLDVGLKQAK